LFGAEQYHAEPDIVIPQGQSHDHSFHNGRVTLKPRHGVLGDSDLSSPHLARHSTPRLGKSVDESATARLTEIQRRENDAIDHTAER
jgi:hypothetical protein